MRSLHIALALTGVATGFAACRASVTPAPPSVAAASTPTSIPSSASPATRAERSRYRATSSHADVVAFLDSLEGEGRAVVLGTLGRTHEGRVIPYAVASRPLVRTAAAARALDRPIVFVQGNIHGGEVEGKEALLALLRDLLADARPNVLDSIVLVAVPIYNADGNERFASQSRNRTEQNGPELVGERANGQGLDLNRDYIKAEAPETRASLAFFRAWDPDVVVDLHTTNGSYHGYALTYAPPLPPVGAAGAYTRDSLLPVLRARMRARHAVETFDYGNFDGTYAAPDADTTTRSWRSYDHRPRFGTNYMGLRDRVAILSEAYSHDPFERRVRSTYEFVREILSLVAERRASLAALAARRRRPHEGQTVAIRSRLTTSPSRRPVVAEEIEATGDSVVTEPGVPAGRRRTGRFRTLQLLVHDRFEPELTVTLPSYYVIPGATGELARVLDMHGIVSFRTIGPRSLVMSRFTIDSATRATRVFQRHRETRLHGRWSDAPVTVPEGTLVVPTHQPLAVLAAYLLEPESDDGLATWNMFDDVARRGAEFPVHRASGFQAAMLELAH